jgi:hypothetical protein
MVKKNKNELSSEMINFFENILTKTQKQIKKIKKEAMSKNLHLKNLRKKFCKFCLTPYDGTEKISTKNKIKKIVCKKCGKINSWKIKI